MKRTAVALVLSFVTAFAVARGQDEQKKPDPAPDKTEKTDKADKADAPPAKKPEVAGAKAPDPSKAAPAGDVLAAGTVKREKLYPLEDGRTWRYELKTWLATTSSEEGAPEETEPPRTHQMEVAVGEAIKIEGKDARCLEWRLDGEKSQLAYYYDEGATISCVRRILGAGEHAHDYTLTPPQPVLQGDLSVGSSWQWTGKVGPTNGKQRFEVLREEKLKKIAGQDEIQAIVVRVTFSGDDESSGVSVKWLSPGIGLVREETEVKADQQVYRTLAVLTKFDIKK
jgi:hypothetical protein